MAVLVQDFRGVSASHQCIVMKPPDLIGTGFEEWLIVGYEQNGSSFPSQAQQLADGCGFVGRIEAGKGLVEDVVPRDRGQRGPGGPRLRRQRYQAGNAGGDDSDQASGRYGNIEFGEFNHADKNNATARDKCTG